MNSKQEKENFKNNIIRILRNRFKEEVANTNVRLAKANLMLFKDTIIESIIKDLNSNNEDLFLIIDKIYMKEYQNYFKAIRLQEKATKEHYTTLIYNEIVYDIENSEENLINTIAFIKTMDYKKALLKDLKNDLIENFNEDIFNELYDKIKNKVIREYKEQLEIEKAEIQEQNKIDIPLGWKVCGLTEIVNKIFKI